MAYAQTSNVTDGVTDVLAVQYNDLRAEAKVAAEGLQIGNDVDLALANTGGNSSDLLETVTISDGQADASLDIDAVATLTYDANDRPTKVTTVFSVLGITLTETLTWVGSDITAIARTLS